MGSWIVRPSGRNFQVRWLEAGKERRLSVGSRDERDATRLKNDVDARLHLGLDPRDQRDPEAGLANKGRLPWSDFVQAAVDHGKATGARSVHHTASRLAIAGQVLGLRFLDELATREALGRLRDALAAGAGGRGKPRSAHTVKNYLATVLAALRWAERQGWVPGVPDVEPVKVSKLRAMKGRPVRPDELRAILAALDDVVGVDAAPSWRYLVRGLWTSGLRLGEAMALHWTDPAWIVPAFVGDVPRFLRVPAEHQKNAMEDAVAITPAFRDLLLETVDRDGWVFEPASLQGLRGRKPRHGRPRAEWVGKVVARAGKAAQVFVAPGKTATAHDLRRGFATNLANAGVPRELVQRLLRHQDPATTARYYVETKAVDDAGHLDRLLDVHREQSPGTRGGPVVPSRAPPAGFEPATFGLGIPDDQQGAADPGENGSDEPAGTA